jgi:ParB family chromosome partitioning protein
MSMKTQRAMKQNHGNNGKSVSLLETSRVVNIPIALIEPNPAQPRRSFEDSAAQELAESIRRYGVLQPLSVRRADRGVGYLLVAGERRLRAAKLAGLKTVPCLILEIGELQSSVLALVENLHRQDLDFLEEADGLMRLIRIYGLTQEEAARRVGKSQSAVANKLRLLRLSPELLEEIRAAGLTERHARALLRIEGDAEREQVFRAILENSMNVAQTDEYVDRLLMPQEPEPEPQPVQIAVPEPEPQPRKEPICIIKDVRFFLNSVNRGMSIMKRSGIDAEYGREETERDIILTIRIPKPAKIG